MSNRKIISPPVLEPNHYDYQPACKEAIKASFDDLRERAIQAGWEERAVNYALMVLATAAMKSESDRLHS